MSSNISVYVGLWVDHSQDAFDQATLTLPTRSANILISALALLVSLAGGATWRLFAYVLHQLRVRHPTQSNPFRQQVQTMLRNNGTPITALVDSVWMSLAWAQTPYATFRTLLPPALIAGLIVAGFGVFSVFVSTVATHSGDNINVLARPGPSCGGWDFNWTAVVFDQNIPVSFEAARAKVDDAQSARTYATWFYSMGRHPLAETSTIFPVSRLPYNVTKEQCPFGGRCLSNDTSTTQTTIVFDTGVLDSHTHLGINAAPRDRSSVRHRMSCSPIDISDMVDPLGEEDGFIRFNISGFVNQSQPLTFPTDPEPLSAGYNTG